MAKNHQKPCLHHRRPVVEALEPRLVLSASGTNPFQPLDVNQDGFVTARDALQVINALHRQAAVDGEVTANATSQTKRFVDVNADGDVTALDALAIVNAMHRQQPVIAATISRPEKLSGSDNLVTPNDALQLTVSVSDISNNQVWMRIDGDEIKPFVNITAFFNGNHAVLAQQELNAIANDTIDDGEHRIEVWIGSAINSEHGHSQIDFPITLQREAVAEGAVSVLEMAATVNDITHIHLHQGIDASTGISLGVFEVRVQMQPGAAAVHAATVRTPTGESFPLSVAQTTTGDVLSFTQVGGNQTPFVSGSYAFQLSFGTSETASTLVDFLDDSGDPFSPVGQIPTFTSPTDGASGIVGDTTFEWVPVGDSTINQINLELIKNGSVVSQHEVGRESTAINLQQSATLLDPSADHQATLTFGNFATRFNTDGVYVDTGTFTRNDIGFVTGSGPVPGEVVLRKFLDKNGNDAIDSADVGRDDTVFSLSSSAGIRTVSTRSVDFNLDRMIDPNSERGIVTIRQLPPGAFTLQEQITEDFEAIIPNSVGISTVFVISGTTQIRNFLNREVVAPKFNGVPVFNHLIHPEQNASAGICDTSDGGVAFGDEICPPADDQDTGGGTYLHNGAVFEQATDLEIPGRGYSWSFDRNYNSVIDFEGPIGHGWDFSDNRRLFKVSSCNILKIQLQFPDAVLGDVARIDGHNRTDLYVAQPDGSFRAPRGFYTELIENSDGTLWERDYDGNTIHYGVPDVDGRARIISRADRNHNTTHYRYDSSGRLSTVIDSLGREIDYFYQDQRLIKVKDFADRSIVFNYDSEGNLISVTSPRVVDTPQGNDFPDGKTTRYTYSTGSADNRLNHNLLTVTAPNEVASGGPPRRIVTYDTDPNSPDIDRVTSQVIGGTNNSGIPSGGTIHYAYVELTSTPSEDDFNTAVFQNTVTDRNGNITVYQFNQLGNPVSIEELTNRQIRPSDPPSFQTQYEYNQDGEQVKRIMPEGNTVDYLYNSEILDRYQHGNVLAYELTPDSSRSGDQATIRESTTYDPIYNQVHTTTDGRGNDPNQIPPIEIPGAPIPDPDRYTTLRTYDYQEGTDFAGLAAILGKSVAEVQTLIIGAGIPMGQGDINGDGRTDQISGNLIRIDYPSVNLRTDSNHAAIEGDTTQEVVELYRYNDFGQLISQTDPEGNVTQFSYYPERDPNGDGVVDTSSGDPLSGGYLNRVTRDTTSNSIRNSGTNPAPVEIRRTFEYDCVGNVTRHIDGRGISTDYRVNELNQVVETIRSSQVDLVVASPAEPVPLITFQYRERIFYDFNDNVIRFQVEDRGDTSGVGGDQAMPGDGNLDGIVDDRDLALIQGFFAQRGGWFKGDFNNDLVVGIPDASMYRQNAGRTGAIPDTPGPAFVDYTFSYDIRDNLVGTTSEVSNTEDLVSEYRYDFNENRVLNLMPEGNATSAVYDERDLLFQSTRGALTPPPQALLSSGDSTNYDVRGGVLCQCITMHYDGNRNVIEIVDGADTDGSTDNNSDLGGPGDRTRYVYDGFDRQTAVIDSTGNQTTYQYDAAGNLVRTLVFGPVGGPSPTSDGPDSLSGPVSISGVIQPTNLVTTNLLRGTESSHDELNRVFQTDNIVFVNTITTARTPDVADGASDLGKSDLTPNDDHAIAGVTGVNIIGRVTNRSEYDKNSRNTFLIEDDGDVYRQAYDGADRVISRIDPEGNRIDAAYDDNHNLIEQKEIDVAQMAGVGDETFLTTYFYDSLNRMTRQVDNIGQTTAYAYDSRDNLVAMADSQGPLTGQSILRRAFPDGPMTINAINGFGNVTRYFYDGINRRTRQEVVLTASGSGDGVNLGADEFGIKTAIPEPDTAQGGGDGLIRTGFVFDRNSLITAILDDQGNVISYLYDNLDRLVAETKGLTVTSTFDNATLLGTRHVVTPTRATLNNPASIPVTQINSQLAAQEARVDDIASLFPPRADQVDDNPPTTIVYGYDQDDNVLILEDENDNEIFTSYDAVNRGIEVRVFRAGQNDNHALDPLFAPDPSSDPSHPSTPDITIVGTNVQSYQYDGLSRLTLATDNNEPADTSDDSVITNAYDSLSRVIEQSQRQGMLSPKVFSSSWRAENLQSGLIYPNNRELEYAYDDLNRLTSVRDAGSPLPIVNYDYIGADRTLTRAYPQNGTRMTYLDDARVNDVGYDGVRRRVQLRHLRDDNSTVVGFTYSHDRMDNLLTEHKLHDHANSEAYEFDSAYRLIDFDRPDANAIDSLFRNWKLDGAGNWTQVTSTESGSAVIESRDYSSMNELTLRQDGTTVSLSYDDSGNQISNGTFANQWDFQNRLRKVARLSDDAEIANYSYDAIGRRIRKSVSNTGSLDGITDYYYDQSHVREERNATDAMTRQYVYGIHVDEALVIDRNLDADDTATGAGDQRLYYHQNPWQSVFAITDGSGAIVEGYLYDAYGRPTLFGPGTNGTVDFGGDDTIAANGASAFDNPFLFTGRRIDLETGQFYYRTRYLDSILGRFTSRDPTGVWGDETNRGNGYAYVGNAPTSFVDPFGMDRWATSAWTYQVHRGVAVDQWVCQNDKWVKLTAVTYDFSTNYGHPSVVLAWLVSSGLITKTAGNNLHWPVLTESNPCEDRLMYLAAEAQSRRNTPYYSLLMYNCRDWANDIITVGLGTDCPECCSEWEDPEWGQKGTCSHLSNLPKTMAQIKLDADKHKSMAQAKEGSDKK